MDPRIWHKVAGFSGMAALGLGTYGAHAFKPKNPTYKDVWHTAFLYHLVHTAALVATPLATHPHIFGGLLTTGIIAFSGTLVKFLTPASGLQGYWDPYPIDMEFKPPCIVLSTIGISKPGKLEGQSTSQCATHLHQLHVCLPASKNKTRLLYRMSLDFAPILQYVPFIDHLWRHFAEKVLNKDLRLVLGQ